jgi:NTP pyrophosphatase (non-canonical NTP hydrolase)
MTNPSTMSVVLRRRVTGKLRHLAELFEVADEPDTEDGLVEYVRVIATLAETAALNDERSLSKALASINTRIDTLWPIEDKAKSLLRRVRSELLELEDAIGDAKLRPELRSRVVEEIGDAMLGLARLALVFGAETALEPVGVAVTKTQARLTEFEKLVRYEPTGTRQELWRMAKGIADGRRTR